MDWRYCNQLWYLQQTTWQRSHRAPAARSLWHAFNAASSSHRESENRLLECGSPRAGLKQKHLSHRGAPAYVSRNNHLTGVMKYLRVVCKLLSPHRNSLSLKLAPNYCSTIAATSFFLPRDAMRKRGIFCRPRCPSVWHVRVLYPDG